MLEEEDRGRRGAEERFPEQLGDRAVMNCDWVVWNNGYRVSLASPGTLQKVSLSE